MFSFILNSSFSESVQRSLCGIFIFDNFDKYLLYLIRYVGLGSIRTATKRAGGTVKNNGHSPGKRLGVKKYSGRV